MVRISSMDFCARRDVAGGAGPEVLADAAPVVLAPSVGAAVVDVLGAAAAVEAAPPNSEAPEVVAVVAAGWLPELAVFCPRVKRDGVVLAAG